MATFDLTILNDTVPVEAAQIEVLLDRIYMEEGTSLSVAISVVGDEDSRRVNEQFLNHDYPTDVIAFDLRGEQGADGEVIVNAPYARREAQERGLEPRSELLFYVAHGVLHLLGHDDETPEDRAAMHALQSRYMIEAGLHPPDELS